MSDHMNGKRDESSDPVGLLFLLILATLIGIALITGLRWAASVFDVAG